MGSYLGRHADYYDTIYAEKDYAGEATFVHACLQKYRRGETRRLLELACGTGNHSFPLARLGYDILATDYSEDMLAQAQKKLAGKDLTLTFRKADMRALDVPEGGFDAALCLFDSIGYVQTNEAIGKALAGVRAALRPGGLFVMEFWHAPAMLKSFDPLRIKRYAVPGGELLRISETTLEPEKSLAHVAYTLYDLQTNGTYTRLQETQTNRYFLRGEMDLWLTTHGFAPLAYFNGYADDKNVSDETWHIVVVARREAA
ncbi:MAG: class I SAM-dependent methyltransferase [Anaerolineae bacterium]|nr:MAG: class I SAM-dependent methyltransferase [Anaerolineae bacterium]